MKLDKKQKIMLILTIIAVLFLGWQIIDLMGSDMSTAVQTTSATATPSAPAKQNPAPAAPQQQTLAAPKDDLNPVRQQIMSQRKEYMQMADQFELAKMQAQLLTQELQIAQTKQQIAQLNQQTAQMSGNTTPVADNDANPSGLQLVYLGQVNGEWSATIMQDGVYQTVQKGSVLPNGMIVNDIEQRGVLYRQGGKTILLGFNGPVVLATRSEMTPEVVAPLADVQQLAAKVGQANAQSAMPMSLPPTSANTTSVVPPIAATATTASAATASSKPELSRSEKLKKLKSSKITGTNSST